MLVVSAQTRANNTGTYACANAASGRAYVPEHDDFLPGLRQVPRAVRAVGDTLSVLWC
jgi:hypothetical protein